MELCTITDSKKLIFLDRQWRAMYLGLVLISPNESWLYQWTRKSSRQISSSVCALRVTTTMSWICYYPSIRLCYKTKTIPFRGIGELYIVAIMYISQSIDSSMLVPFACMYSTSTSSQAPTLSLQFNFEKPFQQHKSIWEPFDSLQQI